MKGLMQEGTSPFKPLIPAVLGILAAFGLFLLCLEWEPAGEVLKRLVTTGSYTEVKTGEEGRKGKTERGFSIDFKEGRIRLWRSDQTGGIKSD